MDGIRQYLTDLPGADEKSAELARQRQAVLTKPAGSLGRLEALAVWLSAWQGRHPPGLDRPLVLVFAGNHGVAAQGVSAFPAEVTMQMVANFEAGGAAINQLAAAAGAELDVVALDLDRPTRDFTTGPAMTEEECAAAFQAGIDAVPAGPDIVLPGDMGIANTTSAAALCCAFFGGAAEVWVGRGTGLDDAGIENKVRVVEAALDRHHGELADPLECLRRLGGRELAAIVGAIVAARRNGIPVLLDGYVCGAAAAALHKLDPTLLDHAVAGHVSKESGHAPLLKALGKPPLLDLGMRLGEASGAAVALGVLKAAVATHTGMASFAEAGVAEKT